MPPIPIQKAGLPPCPGLCHVGFQFPSAENVKMQMGNGLAGVGTAVADHAVAVDQIFSLCDLGNQLKMWATRPLFSAVTPSTEGM